MIENLYKKMNRAVTVKTTIIFFFLFIVLCTLINGKPFGVAELKMHTNGVGILDLERYYSPQYAYHLLESQGELGRKLYKDLILRLDFLFPLSYTLCWMSIITITYRNWLNKASKWQLVSLIPILAGISDYIENGFILTMLSKFPQKDEILASLANAMTVSKGIFTGLSFFLIIVGLLGLLYKKATNER